MQNISQNIFGEFEKCLSSIFETSDLRRETYKGPIRFYIPQSLLDLIFDLYKCIIYGK